MISPKVPIHVNGITMGPGVGFGGGVSFGGVDFTSFVGKYLEVNVDHVNQVNIIVGVYPY